MEKQICSEMTENSAFDSFRFKVVFNKYCVLLCDFSNLYFITWA